MGNLLINLQNRALALAHPTTDSKLYRRGKINVFVIFSYPMALRLQKICSYPLYFLVLLCKMGALTSNHTRLFVIEVVV